MQFPCCKQMAAAVIVAGLTSPASVLAGGGAGACDLHWSDQFIGNGVTGSATELYVYNDGSGDALYVGGDFASAGGLPSTGDIARWNGSRWSSVGAGFTSAVNALTTYDFGSGTHLVAAGFHNMFGNDQLAQWNGSQWQSVPPGVPDAWLAGIGVYQGELYVSGAFFFQGSQYIVRWNGSQWIGVGNGLASVVWDLKVFDDGSTSTLAVAGIPLVQGVPGTLGLAKWNGTQWQAFGSGINAEGRALAIYDFGDGPSLYVGGAFTTAGGLPANRIARWHNGQWSAMGASGSNPGGGFNGTVFALQIFDDGNGPSLYAGGEFTASGSLPINHLARWNGTTWEQVGDGITDGNVYGLGVFDDDGPGLIPPALYVSGNFTTVGAGAISSPGIARWGRCAVPSCPADIAPAGSPPGDGQVNVDDLLAVINSWGPCASLPCLADIAPATPDGQVNVDDLLAVINGWGVCP